MTRPRDPPPARTDAGADAILHPVRHRLLLGPLFIALVIALAWLDQWLDGVALGAPLRGVFGGRETFPPGTIVFVASVILAVLGARELATILAANSIVASKRIVTLAAVAGLMVSCLVPSDLPSPVAAQVVGTVGTCVLLVSLAYHSRHKTVEGAVAAAGGTLLAFVYLGLMFGFIAAIRREHSAWVLLWFLLTTKACDTGAFFTGKAVGRHKLILWLSPGKTWEGLIGGVVSSAAVGAAGLWLVRESGEAGTPAAWAGAAAGALFAVSGQLGDLVMSLFKRDAGMKDSSHLVPGFGGVLDMLDSPILVAPIAYWWLHFAAP